MIALSNGSADLSVMLPRLRGFTRIGPITTACRSYGIADALVEERCRREDQLEIRHVEFGPAAHETVGLTDIRRQHPAPADQVIQ